MLKPHYFKYDTFTDIDFIQIWQTGNRQGQVSYKKSHLLRKCFGMCSSVLAGSTNLQSQLDLWLCSWFVKKIWSWCKLKWHTKNSLIFNPTRRQKWCEKREGEIIFSTKRNYNQSLCGFRTEAHIGDSQIALVFFSSQRKCFLPHSFWRQTGRYDIHSIYIKTVSS